LSKILVLGLGNPLLSDDAVGLIIVEKLSHLINEPSVEFKTSEKVGLTLIELLAGYEQAIIIDSIISAKAPVGAVFEFSLDDLPSSPRLRSPHDADFKSAVLLAKKAGLKMPEKIIIFGIEVANNLTFNDKLTSQLSKKLPSIIEELKAKIQKIISEK